MVSRVVISSTIFIFFAASGPEALHAKNGLWPVTQTGRPLQPKWSYRMGLKFHKNSLVVESIEPLSFASVLKTDVFEKTEGRKFKTLPRKEKSQRAWRQAQNGSLRAGDLIVAVNYVKVGSNKDFESACTREMSQNPGPWTIRVKRDGQTLDYTAPTSCNPLELIGCGPIPAK